jgi:chromosome segregation ATPase
MEELLKQILEEIGKINTKLESNEKFQELVVRQFGELNDKLTHMDYQLDKLDRHARQHHDEIELVAIQVRGLQRNPDKDDVTDYFAKKKFSLVMEGD